MDEYELDLQILQHLRDAPQTIQRIAEKTGATEAAVESRIAALAAENRVKPSEAAAGRWMVVKTPRKKA